MLGKTGGNLVEKSEGIDGSKHQNACIFVIK
jgi:hypothetical protein